MGHPLLPRRQLRRQLELPVGRRHAAAAPRFDPPTAVGTVYDEVAGTPPSFEIRTDLSTFHLSRTCAPAGTAFGSLSLRFPASQGVLLVEHSGFHRLSVAFKAACRDSVEVE